MDSGKERKNTSGLSPERVNSKLAIECGVLMADLTDILQKSPIFRQQLVDAYFKDEQKRVINFDPKEEVAYEVTYFRNGKEPCLSIKRILHNNLATALEIEEIEVLPRFSEVKFQVQETDREDSEVLEGQEAIDKIRSDFLVEFMHDLNVWTRVDLGKREKDPF